MFGGCAIDGTVASAFSGKEACLLIFWEVEPDGLGLEVIEDVGEFALEGFNFMGEWLLEVK